MINLHRHFYELKVRSFYVFFSALTVFFVCWNSQEQLVYLVGRPFLHLDHTFIYLELTEAFSTLLTLSFVFTFLLVFPLAVYQLWCFLIPSFYKLERFGLSLVCSLFLGGLVCEIGVFYFVLLPQLVKFLLSFELSGDADCVKQSVEFTARLAHYVTLVVNLLTVFLILFQLPFGVCFFFSKNKVKVDTFYLNRHFGAGISLLVSAFLVPPDIWSQLGLFFLFFVVFEVMIWIGIFFQAFQKDHI